MEYMQLYYELRMELEALKDDSIIFGEIVSMMNDMEARLKGGKDYE